jgi:hypothetical protein
MSLERCWSPLDVAGKMLVEHWKAAGGVLEDDWQGAGNNLIKENILTRHSIVAPRSVLSNF